MTATTRTDTALTDPDEVDHNPTSHPAISDLIASRLSRRRLMGLGGAGAGIAVLQACGGGGGGGSGFPIVSAPAPAPAPGPAPDPAPAPAPAPAPGAPKLGFKAVPKSLADTVSVPPGYSATVLYALGDPLTSSTPAYRNDGSDTDFDNRAGDHHDGMEFYGLNAAGTARDAKATDRGLLVMNHEALTDQFLHVNGTTANPRPVAEADKEIPAHGVSVVEIRKGSDGKFATDKASPFNRRITPATPMVLSGVARGSALMKTKYSTSGNDARGTINNCGTGYSPWGTYLTGEENWAGYFTRATGDDAARGGAATRSVVSLRRYGRNEGAASRHGWETAGPDDKYARWNIAQTGASADGSDDYRNELNTFGYIVEIDPYDKNVAIRKRTSLGRFGHESANFGKLVPGQPLAVYMGDDSQNEYMYKFVSTANWDAADANPANRITTGDKYLNSGKLYVAKFAADGTGQWIELDFANPTIAGYAAYAFADQADVVVNARLAADAVGATKMDRPEWCAVHPVTGEIYYTLTNNANRKIEPTGTQTQVDAANPRSYTDAPGATTPRNVNGHIVRLKENADRSAATAFTWDVYLFGAQADADRAQVNLSGLTDDQDFSSPDGLWFSPTTGFCFIQTDDGAYTDVSNCMMVVGIPGTVGDGTTATLNYTKADSSTLAVQTRVGQKPTVDTLRRFLVGPKDCEITGCCETPDGKAVFVNIQHPGESISKANVSDPSKFTSHWPGNAGYGPGGAVARPRSATIVITKDDGGLIGL
ncbi:MAG: PhoX family phosphatase [Variovorax sp.]|nr:MAG: PhoX family phosphatase [Variovorax sp.]